MSPGRQLAFAAVVALVALLLPARAFAALLPICEATPVWTTIPATPEPTCEVVTTVDEETGETTKAAPICDPRGASAIAPQRVLPVEDSRIEAPKSCSGADDQLVGSHPDRRNDAPSAAGWTLLHACLSDGLAVPPPVLDTEGVSALRPRGAPRAGVTRRIYHPPR